MLTDFLMFSDALYLGKEGDEGCCRNHSFIVYRLLSTMTGGKIPVSVQMRSITTDISGATLVWDCQEGRIRSQWTNIPSVNPAEVHGSLWLLPRTSENRPWPHSSLWIWVRAAVTHAIQGVRTCPASHTAISASLPMETSVLFQQKQAKMNPQSSQLSSTSQLLRGRGAVTWL